MKIINKLTKNYLKMNKKRTIVTIIGIILAGAMISAITTLAVSFQGFMINVQEESNGPWQGSFTEIKYQNAKYIQNNAKFDETMITTELSMGKLDDNYVRVRQYDEKALKSFAVKLVEGNYPTNSNEILISESYSESGDTLKVGDKITINLGKRIYEGEERIEEDILSDETFVVSGTKTFTVSGIMERQRFEAYTISYYGAITLLDENTLTDDSIVNIGVITKNVKKIYDDMKEVATTLNLYENETEMENNIDYNSSLLIYYGVNGAAGFTSALYSVCAILILIIAIGSIVVIYNSFAISVSERKKQFGILRSIGATKKQIKQLVLNEGTFLAIIGIPLGILSGILGIAVTLNVVNSLLKPILSAETSWNIELIVSWPSIIIAIILIAITIYLSVIIPARKASKISPIDAIRQTDEIKVKSKKLKTPRFLRKIYGIEGDIALKNLKRSRKRYRTTIISLVISIVLFMTFDGFVTYMFKGFDAMYVSIDYDYQMIISRYSDGKDIPKIMEEVGKVEGVKKYALHENTDQTFMLEDYMINKQLRDAMNTSKDLKNMYYYEMEDRYQVNTVVLALDENNLNEYAKEVGLNKLKDNEIILVNYVNAIYPYKVEYKITNHKVGDTIKFDSNQYDYKEQIYKTVNDAIETTVAKVTDKLPYGISLNTGNLIAVMNQKTLAKISNVPTTSILVLGESNKNLTSDLEQIESNYQETVAHIDSVKDQLLMMRNLKLIIQIFLYGFIALISAIGISNILNTISTNIALRRREFAMLKSVGMTDKSFNKMLNLECVFYGTKALLYGLPLGTIMCFLLNIAFENVVTFNFQLPISSMLICIVAVYFIVFMTMIYASRKIKKENIIDVLREDNI